MSGAAPGDGQQYASVYEQAFSDAASVGGWAKEAVWWAVYHDIWCGADSAGAGTVLAPAQPADRAQIAVMIVRYLNYNTRSSVGARIADAPGDGGRNAQHDRRV